ncbi:MAG TPA: hypothetical protein VGC11_09730 [Acidimicrobiia bacterium]
MGRIGRLRSSGPGPGASLVAAAGLMTLMAMHWLGFAPAAASIEHHGTTASHVACVGSSCALAFTVRAARRRPVPRVLHGRLAPCLRRATYLPVTRHGRVRRRLALCVSRT